MCCYSHLFLIISIHIKQNLLINVDHLLCLSRDYTSVKRGFCGQCNIFNVDDMMNANLSQVRFLCCPPGRLQRGELQHRHAGAEGHRRRRRRLRRGQVGPQGPQGRNQRWVWLTSHLGFCVPHIYPVFGLTTAKAGR